MSIRGTIFPAEASQTYEELAGHLSRFFSSDPESAISLERNLLSHLDLVKQTFRQGGSLTLDATRTLIALKTEEKRCWKEGMQIDTCTSKDLAEKVDLFWKSSRKKEGWIINDMGRETGTFRPHQMPLLFVKRKEGISFLTFDTRLNFEGIRSSLLQALLPLDAPIQMYLSKQLRQHDWTICSQISLEDLHQLDHLDTEKMFNFIETYADSTETQTDGKWKLIVSDRLPLSHMRLIQSMESFKNYEAWALANHVVTQEEMEAFKDKMRSKNPEWESLSPDAIELNRRGIHRFRKNVAKLIDRIVKDQPPIQTLQAAEH